MPPDLDAAALTTTATVNGAPAGEPGATAVQPLEALAEVASIVAATHGGLREGHLVITGATRFVPVAAGDRMVAGYGPLGEASCTIAPAGGCPSL